MPKSDPRVLHRLQDLHARVARLEQALQIERPPEARRAEPAASPRPPQKPDEKAPAASQPAPASETPGRPRGTSNTPGDFFTLESVVARWVFAIVGAASVVVGAAFFLKLAWDAGWLGQMSDRWKCLLSAAFGFAMLAAGEIARRAWGRAAGAGLTAAGLGVIYITAYAAHAWWGLVPASVGFVQLGGVTVLGVAIGARAKLPWVSTLALLGGFATPLLFTGSSAPPIAVPMHLAALLVIALALSLRDPERFGAPRVLGWWGSALVGGWWVASVGAPGAPFVALAYLVAVWALTHAELVIVTLRAAKTVGAPDSADEITLKRTNERLVPRLSASVAITTWAVALGVLVLRESAVMEEWCVPAAAFVATAALALVLGSHLRVLRDPVRTPDERLAAVLAVQAGVLLLVTVALALSGWAQAAAWLGLGVACALAGAAVRSSSLVRYGVVSLALASGRLLLFDGFTMWGLVPRTPTTLATIGALTITSFTALAVAAACAWLAAAWAVDRRHPEGLLSWIATIASFAMLLIALTDPDPLTRASFVAVCLASLVFIALRISLALPTHAVGTGGLLLAIGLYLFVWPVAEWHASTAAPGLAQGLWVGLALAGLLGAVALATKILAGRDGVTRIVSLVAGAAATLTLLYASSVEVMRTAEALTNDPTAQSGSLTLWWGCFAIGLLVAGAVSRRALARRAGLALLGLAAVKLALIDLAALDRVWRVAGFVGVGLMMLAVAVGYARASRRSRSASSPPSPPAGVAEVD